MDFSLSLSDNFNRTQDPPYSPIAAIITHDRNVASLELKVAPGGGRIQVLLRLNNVLDLSMDTPTGSSPKSRIPAAGAFPLRAAEP
jgi:hypothetical protein